jgi:ABC-type molybdate transport system substrate-binding protein
MINFDEYQNKNVEEIQEKLLEIIKKEQQEKREFSIAFLKNIDKISSKQEAKELLLSLLGQEANASLWKYTIDGQEKIPNLAKFVFIASISNSDSKNLEELQKNFRTVEVPLSKNQLVIFSLLGGVEVIIFFFLIRNKRKSHHEKLQELD